MIFPETTLTAAPDPYLTYLQKVESKRFELLNVLIIFWIY
jgi:hypothetical protein